MSYRFAYRKTYNRSYCFVKRKWVHKSALKRYKFRLGLLSNIIHLPFDKISENSRYYFEDEFKGKKYIYVHMIGVMDLKTDEVVKVFDWMKR